MKKLFLWLAMFFSFAGVEQEHTRRDLLLLTSQVSSIELFLPASAASEQRADLSQEIRTLLYNPSVYMRITDQTKRVAIISMLLWDPIPRDNCPQTSEDLKGILRLKLASGHRDYFLGFNYAVELGVPSAICIDRKEVIEMLLRRL